MFKQCLCRAFGTVRCLDTLQGCFGLPIRKGWIMDRKIRIGIIGDYDGRPSHIATNEAIQHGGAKMGLAVETVWVATDTLLEGAKEKLEDFHGLWCAPGSPYRSMLGALEGIRFAREEDYPFLGTCGGFQHAVLEYAGNVLHIEEVLKEDFDLYAPNAYITPLACSLLGQTRHICLDKTSGIYEIYGREDFDERYNCSFGLDKEFQKKLEQQGFKVAGMDEEGGVRILDLEQNRFFIATLFQPQLSSSFDRPHPLILAYLAEAEKFKGRLEEGGEK